ncbi:MAG: recombination-associated protein RdgC [Desulfosarcinaceae bacterium]|nr:recombination-associated protein RdgC [Desulfosarcinaceae bacterium]
MGLLSRSVSITRYQVEKQIDAPVTENVLNGLKKYAITEIDNEAEAQAVGWTCFENPYAPDFEQANFTVGTYFVFSLRIDKKAIPVKVVKKHTAIEMQKRLAASGRDFLSRNEKKMIREHVLNVLNIRIPATPYVHDLLWDYEAKRLLFFNNQKGANEALETLFRQSFGLRLIRLFPYTMGELTAGLSESQRDVMGSLSPARLAKG